MHDRITTLGTGVDGTVRRISTAYDVVGNVKSVTSYDNATVGSGNVVNQVVYEYDANGLLSKDYSNPSGTVATASTPHIGYTYDVTKSGTNFTKQLRLTSVKYPGGKIINYAYGTAGSVDDLFSRYSAIKDGTTDVAQYVYNGAATPVKTTYPQPGLVLDYTASGALNNFGRITDHAWKKSTADVVRIKHAYDRVGNRKYREDTVGTNFSEVYAYDGVNQLTDMQRGVLNTAKTGVSTKKGQENFAFDATGNWGTYKQDNTGGGFTLTQARTHNRANEVLTIAGSSTNVALDRNGNMTKMPKPDNWSAAFTCTYDAWNRLVIVKDGTTTVATYGYNGLNHRVKKIIGSETRLFYFNQDWQCLEERVSSTVAQTYIWGSRYIDDLICRDKSSERLYSLADPNWNVVALTNTSGTVQERMAYSTFGKVTWLNASFVAKASSGFVWNRTYTGQVLDETGLMLYRNRYYHTGLGRFSQRDPIGYEAKDVSLYRYVKNRSLSLLDPFGHSGGFPMPHPPPKSPPQIPPCKRFREWLDKEMKDTSWHEGLPDCPCNVFFIPGWITDDVGTIGYFDSWNSLTKYWEIEPRHRHWYYHRGATFCMRSRSHGKSNREHAGSQCCYDATGALITSGMAAGSADKDRRSIFEENSKHKEYDMSPANWAWEADGNCFGKLSEQYYDARPVIGANKCKPNPYTPPNKKCPEDRHNEICCGE